MVVRAAADGHATVDGALHGLAREPIATGDFVGSGREPVRTSADGTVRVLELAVTFDGSDPRVDEAGMVLRAGLVPPPSTVSAWSPRSAGEPLGRTTAGVGLEAATLIDATAIRMVMLPRSSSCSTTAHGGRSRAPGRAVSRSSRRSPAGALTGSSSAASTWLLRVRAWSAADRGAGRERVLTDTRRSGAVGGDPRAQRPAGHPSTWTRGPPWSMLS